MAAGGVPDRGWRAWSAAATCLLAGLVAVGGPLWKMPRVGWPALAGATAVAILAQAAVLRYRQGTRTVLFAWGEAALIVVVYQVPGWWVAPVIGVGVLIGNGLYVARTGGRWTPRRIVDAANLTLAGAAGASTSTAHRPAATRCRAASCGPSATSSRWSPATSRSAWRWSRC